MRSMIRMGLVLVPAAAALLSGCTGLLVGGAAAGAGAGTVMYVQGDLEATLEQPRSEVVEASRQAIADMGLRITDEKETDEDWIFECVRNDGKSVAVKVRELTPAMSRVYIRVGTFGDEAYSWRLLEKTQENLE
jgi:hypothetical protein